MGEFVFVGEAARELGIGPHDLAVALYTGRVPSDRCPVVGGRRLIPREVLPELRKALEERPNRRQGA
jgi:hypothetical protein